MQTVTDTHRISRWLVLTLIATALAFAGVLGYALHRYYEATRSQLRPFEMPGRWLRAPEQPAYSGFFRKHLQLSGNVRHAWVVIAARDAFELTVNGNPIGRHYLWRPTRPFQNGLSAKGQRIGPTTSALALNFPREYQWDGHEHFRLPVFLDITSELRPGHNVVCIEAESRAAPAMVRFGGQIQMWSGETITLDSDSTWSAEPVPPGVQPVDWTHPDYRDHAWRGAITVDSPRRATYSAAPPRAFSTPFSANWLRHPTASNSDAVWFETTWQLADEADRGWLRVAANRHFTLFVNDKEVRVADDTRAMLDSGHWLIGSQRAWDTPATPELLDPDEVGSVFAGRRFESPRHGDPTADALTSTENVLNRTRDKPRATNRSDMPGTYDPKRTLAETRRTPDKPYAFPDKVTPKALTRDRAIGDLLGFDVTNLLRPGANSIRVRVSEPDSVDALCWPAQLALDAEADMVSGARAHLVSDSGWTSTGQQLDGTPAPSVAALVAGPAAKSSSPLPTLTYRGVAKTSLSRNEWPWLTFVSAVFTFMAITIALLITTLFNANLRLAGHGDNDSPDRSAVVAVCHGLLSVLLSATAVLLGAALLDCCFAERHETLWFTQPWTWQFVFAAAALVATVTATVQVLGHLRLNRLRSRGHAVEFSMRRLPKTKLWGFVIVWLLLLCGFLRVYKLDYQPLDDDEYASTQAILAIEDSGIPQFAPEGVWYTRSPLFHYLMGGIVAVCGPNLWSLRVPAAVFAMATAWLTYLFGARLLRNPWIGMAALVLMTLHPFQIFTGHVIRFYQMQQFFALLTMYCFCKGFVTGQSQKWRYATIAAFLAAVLSQEISAVMGAPLAIGYLLFARDRGWRENSKLAIVAACALAVIAIDYLAFQTRCLTRVEGVSASLEAAVKPHFWQPYNFLAIYIGYSRLHVALSVFLLLGLPFVWREKNRNTITLHFMLLSGVVLTNLLITHVSLRYQYWLIPIWILLSLDGMRALLVKLCAAAHDPRTQRNRYLWNLGLASSVFFIVVVLSWSPWRIAGSYDVKLLGDSTGAVQYVRSQLRDGDVLAATEPHTHAALVEAGQIDYDISVPLLYDFAMLQDGRLIDRNGGAEVVGNLREFQDVCRRHDRVWILLNREKFRSRGKNLRWEYPGARFELFVRENCELRHRTYLWSVYLWDAQRGQLTPFRDGGA